MARLFSFAHMSDPHLPLGAGLPRPLSLLAGKRLSGYLSWRRHRHALHRPEILAEAIADARATRCEHILITGDLINIALPGEYRDARTWLSSLGRPEDITVVPGNHDLTVPVSWAEGPGLWQPWMRGDEDLDGRDADGFPFVRIRGPIAFVAVSTAVPTPVFRASGTIGEAQLDRLGAILEQLAGRGLIRIIALHHSPLDRSASSRKALTDRQALKAVLSKAGAELIVHGHLHKPCFGALSGPNGQIPVIGAPSASTFPSSHSQAARWHLYTVEDDPTTGLALKLTIRQFTTQSQRFETVGQFAFPVTPDQ